MEKLAFFNVSVEKPSDACNALKHWSQPRFLHEIPVFRPSTTVCPRLLWTLFGTATYFFHACVGGSGLSSLALESTKGRIETQEKIWLMSNLGGNLINMNNELRMMWLHKLIEKMP